MSRDITKTSLPWYERWNIGLSFFFPLFFIVTGLVILCLGVLFGTYLMGYLNPLTLSLIGGICLIIWVISFTTILFLVCIDELAQHLRDKAYYKDEKIL